MGVMARSSSSKNIRIKQWEIREVNMLRVLVMEVLEASSRGSLTEAKIITHSESDYFFYLLYNFNNFRRI